MPRTASPPKASARHQAFWMFPQLSPTANSELSSARLFTERSEAADVLAEMPQNIIDARRPGSVPCMRLTLLTLPRAALAPLGFEMLAKRAHAAGVSAPDAIGDRVRVLLIRDNGVGLGGEWRDGYGKGPWQRFTRWVGAAGKGGSEGGRHGLGRLVTLAPSLVRGVYVFTVRAEDGAALFSGISEMPPHELNGVPFQSFGVFGVADPDKAGNVLPYEGDEAYAAARLVGCGRAPGETGLTLAVPALRPGFDFATLRIEALRLVALSVATGRITVEISDTDSGEFCALDTGSVRLELARAAADTGDATLADAVQMLALASLPDPVALPSLDEGDIEVGVLEALRARFAAGQTVAATIPVTVRRDGRDAETCPLTVAAVRSPGLSMSWKVRMRDGIVSQRASRASEGRATMALACGSALSSMLGDAEDATHTRWRSRIARSKGWRSPEAAIEIWNEAGERFAALLGGAAGSRVDHELLADVFAMIEDGRPVSGLGAPAAHGADGIGAFEEPDDVAAAADGAPDDAAAAGSPGVQQGGEVVAMKAIREGDKRGFEAVLTERGRRSYRSGLGRDDTRHISIELWYPSADRTSPREWSPSDFAFGERGFEVRVEGAEDCALENNRIVVRGVTEAFRLAVVGPFDTRRNLAVRIANRGR